MYMKKKWTWQIVFIMERYNETQVPGSGLTWTIKIKKQQISHIDLREKRINKIVIKASWRYIIVLCPILLLIYIFF